MTMYNACVKISILGTSSFMLTITFYFILKSIVVVPRQVQQPITYFRGARDDFMVHDVNNPLIGHLYLSDILARAIVKNKHQKYMFYNELWLCAQILTTNSRSLIMNATREACVITQGEKKSSLDIFLQSVHLNFCSETWSDNFVICNCWSIETLRVNLIIKIVCGVELSFEWSLARPPFAFLEYTIIILRIFRYVSGLGQLCQIKDDFISIKAGWP